MANENVIITGARAPVAVDIGRSFCAANFSVHFADSVRPWAAICSNSSQSGYHHLPPARTNFHEFANCLYDLVNELQPALLIPTCEEVFYVSAAAEMLGFADIVFAPPLKTLRTLHSKIEFVKFASELGIPAPQTWSLSDKVGLQSIPLSTDQLVLKPEFSRFGNSALLRPSEKQIEGWEPTSGQNWAAQTFIEGEEICVWTAAREGEIVASAAYRPKWRFGQTAAYAFETISCPAAVEIAKTIAKATHLDGHLSFDMILTANGDTLPIECNPRAVSGLHLFDASPDLALAILNKRKCHATESLRYLSLGMLFLGIPAALRHGRLGGLLKDWRDGRDVLSRIRDRLPILGTVADTARFAVVGLLKGNSPAGQTTDDIEWNGEPLLWK